MGGGEIALTPTPAALESQSRQNGMERMVVGEGREGPPPPRMRIRGRGGLLVLHTIRVVESRRESAVQKRESPSFLYL